MKKTDAQPMDFIDENGIMPVLEKAIELRHNICLRGATGTGKTFLIKELARMKEKPLRILNMTSTSGVDEVKGKWVLQPIKGNGLEPKWIDGVLTEAMRKGEWIVVEEANFMAPELSSVFYSVMDDRREIIIDEKDGEIVKAHEDFRLFMTCNWDYQGTVRFNDAVANRINSWFDIRYLSAALESRLIAQRTGISLDIANKLATIAASVRANASKAGFPDLSTRILLNWAQMIHSGFDPQEAAEYSVIPVLAYGDKDKDIVRTYLKGVFNARRRGDED